MFKKKNRSKEIDFSNRIIEKSIKNHIKQMQSVDPETEIQWQRLKTTLANEEKGVNIYSFFTRWFLPKPAIALSFGVILIIVVGVLWFNQTNLKTYSTAKGEHITILLSDSTEVKLNSFSEIIVSRKIFDNTRRVTLKGEAFFNVRKTGAPFKITTEYGIVEVVGTEFNVRVRNEKMEVAVQSGSVKVGNNYSGKDSSVVLTKGQIVKVEKNCYPELPSISPFSDYPGWIIGKYQFYRTSLAEVCSELELQFDKKIIIQNDKIGALTLTGAIDGKNIENALASLTELTGNKYRYEEGKYIIY